MHTGLQLACDAKLGILISSSLRRLPCIARHSRVLCVLSSLVGCNDASCSSDKREAEHCCAVHCSKNCFFFPFCSGEEQRSCFLSFFAAAYALRERSGGCRRSLAALANGRRIMRLTAGGSSTRSWQPTATADTTDLHFWLHWRVALCALWVFCCMAVAAYLIWRHEGPGAHRRPGGAGAGGKDRRRPAGVLYDDEAWRPCLRDIHPAWLLAYRLISFFVLFSLLIVIVISDGGNIFYYYTQWTFILVTIYFGLGTALSIYGCSKFTDWNVVAAVTDVEHRPYVAHGAATKPSSDGEDGTREIAGFWGYLLQIIYQTNAGVVMLTDCVFWFIIFPFLTIKDYNLNFLLVGMHSVNAVLLLGEAALNSLRFPWFRIAYFFLWTALYVIFQWIVHASTPIWWPYPFLDLSANLAPLWYFAVAFMQLPCYVVFSMVIKLKHHLLLKWFPDSTVVAD